MPCWLFPLLSFLLFLPKIRGRGPGPPLVPPLTVASLVASVNVTYLTKQLNDDDDDGGSGAGSGSGDDDNDDDDLDRAQTTVNQSCTDSTLLE